MASLSGSLLRMLEALRFGEDLERLGHLIRRRLGDLSPAALPHGPPRAVPELDELLEGSDDKRLDLAYAASLLAWEDAPHAVDVPRVVARVHTLGDALRVQRLRVAAHDPAHARPCCLQVTVCERGGDCACMFGQAAPAEREVQQREIRASQQHG